MVGVLNKVLAPVVGIAQVVRVRARDSAQVDRGTVVFVTMFRVILML